MGVGIRVTFSPSRATKTNGAIDVPGATLGFQCLGQDPPPVARGPVPATLVLHGAYLERSRGVSLPDFQRFASLELQLELSGDPARPRAALAADVDYVYVEPTPPKGEPFRELIIALSDAFIGASQPPAKVTRLRLPKPPERARFFELGAQLLLGGSLESDIVQNERLDVPLRFPFGDQLFWITAVPAEQDFQPELVIFDEAGKEQQRLPVQTTANGPGDSQTIDLTGIRGGSARLLELHRNNTPLLPLMRLGIDEIRERLGAGMVTDIAEVLRPDKKGEAGPPLSDGGVDVPVLDQDPAAPPLLPPGSSV